MSIHVRRMPEQVRGRYYNTVVPSSHFAESDERANVLRAEAEATACLFVAFCSNFLFVIKNNFLADTFVGVLSIRYQAAVFLARTGRIYPGVSQLL